MFQHRDDERRRGVRIETELWIRVVGIDPQRVARRGNISVSGVFFEADIDLGAPGRVEHLEIATTDLAMGFSTMACLVRVIGVRDLFGGDSSVGMAFQFLPQHDETRTAILQTVGYVAEALLGDSDALLGDLNIDATIADAEEETTHPGHVQALDNQGLVLETAWPIEEGAIVHLAIEPPFATGPLEVRGIVQNTLSGKDGGGRYRVQVSLFEDRPAVSGGGTTLQKVIDHLLEEMVTPKETSYSLSGAPHLSGQLSRVPLTSVLTLVEMERLSGRLQLQRGETRATLFARNGQILDVELQGLDAATPRAGLAILLTWAEGDFVLRVEAVDREDRVGLSTTALLLDLVREQDEGKR